MIDYIYVPDDDSEYGPVWEASEALDVFTESELADARPAALLVSLDGSRGHYLAAGFLWEAANLVLCDPSVAKGSNLAAKAEEWQEAADAYDRHQGLTDDDSCQASPVGEYDEESDLCSACEWISEIADEAESALSDLGYIVTWDDGVTIHRVQEG